MAEDNKIPEQVTTGTDTFPDRQVKVNAQYIKDLSFENPNAPKSLMRSKEQPKIDINLDLRRSHLQDNTHALDMHIHAKAYTDEQTLFVLELVYGGLFTLENIPEAEIEPAMLIFCPTLLFPFARRVVSDVTRDGGFPPLTLEPIDFGKLYLQRQQQAGGGESAKH
ncbi:MAG: protein-export chaperone SecB [Hyphomicrobiales bacterium]|nr:protein-export chaperone SecB [Hyphomicrobiales bacterium]